MGLAMSDVERDRLRVMHELRAKRISQTGAAAVLGLCTRQVRRLYKAWIQEGDRALVHKSRGRPSPRRIEPALRRRVRRLLKEKYEGFGPTLAGEHLLAEEGIAIGRETLRKWMRQWSLEYPRRRPRPHRKRRPRRSCFGELVQIDTSVHDWLGEGGETAVLIALIDDATGRKFARFYASDGTESNMDAILRYILRLGRPMELYADRAGHFTQTLGKRGAGRDGSPATQIERALEQLGIKLILARSPQGKGRVERSHRTDQDRLIKKLRLQGIKTIADANRFLEEVYLPDANARFARPPAAPANLHRDASDYDLAAILCVHEARQVQNDLTIQVDGQCHQLLPPADVTGLAKTTVTIERRLDGALKVRRGSRYLDYEVLAERPPRPKKDRKKPKSTRKHRPSADHPWRRGCPREREEA